ncbi:MAG: glycosyltransferase [Candidatus Micrarchaeota archaeon]
MSKLHHYAEIVGEEKIEEIENLGSILSEKSMAHVNATFYGGGVAEMLNTYIPLLNEAGLKTEWRLLKGSREFFNVTKKMHNALQSDKVSFSKQELECYESTLEMNSLISNLNWYDCVVIDDPQPCGLINLYSRESPSLWKPLPEFLRLPILQKKQPWVWRVHIDLSNPNPALWHYLKKFIKNYDAVVVSHLSYATDISRPIFVMPPAIDPLADKNRYLSETQVNKILEKHGIDSKSDVPLVTQVSRFDPWKDPLGVIRAFRKVRKSQKCQLVLIGSMAADDPEGGEVFNRIYRAAQQMKDVTLITAQDDLLVNALQRKSAVVVQKSIREGFGLTVSEALWKGTPVVGGNVGGIPLQIKDGVNGFLVSSDAECADRIEYLLKNPKKAREMGANGRENIRENFLITRLVKDELNLCRAVTGLAGTSSLMNAPQDIFRRLTHVKKLFPFKNIAKFINDV